MASPNANEVQPQPCIGGGEHCTLHLLEKDVTADGEALNVPRVASWWPASVNVPAAKKRTEF